MRDPSFRDNEALIPAGACLDTVLRQGLLDRLEARVLLMHALGLSRSQFITQSHRRLTADEACHISRVFQRRIAGEPIAYILGEREFFGLAFAVTPDVLIPRADTELLVELAVQKLPLQGSVLDMGTGSGAIAVSVAHARADARVSALDFSMAALKVAKRNAQRHQVKVQFLQSDWYSAVGNQKFDVIVANPPYIAAQDSHLTQGDLRFEPILALTDHADGMSALHAISKDAHRHLNQGGWLLMEHGYDQSALVRALLNGLGFTAVQSWQDLAGIERVTGGKPA